MATMEEKEEEEEEEEEEERHRATDDNDDDDDDDDGGGSGSGFAKGSKKKIKLGSFLEEIVRTKANNDVTMLFRNRNDDDDDDDEDDVVGCFRSRLFLPKNFIRDNGDSGGRIINGKRKPSRS
uniref:Uncharacterized protein n=1 Tax=Vespula pensylvanica TaxID=30213 RepID=A0A834KM41_VESPE|nr:hypothetical protein H0235_014002 [Vespula pensylvanica]